MALLSGFVDVDAVSIALARGARQGSVAAPAAGIVLACISNNVFKSAVALFSGAGSFRRRVALGLTLMSAVGGLVAAVMAWRL